MDRSSEPLVALVGDVAHGDFTALHCWLAERADVVLAQDPVTAVAKLRTCAPHTILVCQSRPGRWTQSEIENLLQAAPMARVLAVLGSWCEGEMRSGRPWHGVERVYWYNALGRLSSGGFLHRTGRRPRTESPAEQIEAALRGLSIAASSRQATIIARSRQAFAPLADLCQLAGYQPQWLRSAEDSWHGPAELIVWNADDTAPAHRLAHAAAIQRSNSQARLIVLLNFPRRDELDALLAAGCDAVLGKPLLVTDLWPSLALDRVVRQEPLAG